MRSKSFKAVEKLVLAVYSNCLHRIYYIPFYDASHIVANDDLLSTLGKRTMLFGWQVSATIVEVTAVGGENKDSLREHIILALLIEIGSFLVIVFLLHTLGLPFYILPYLMAIVSLGWEISTQYWEVKWVQATAHFRARAINMASMSLRTHGKLAEWIDSLLQP